MAGGVTATASSDISNKINDLCGDRMRLTSPVHRERTSEASRRERAESNRWVNNNRRVHSCLTCKGPPASIRESLVLLACKCGACRETAWDMGHLLASPSVGCDDIHFSASEGVR